MKPIILVLIILAFSGCIYKQTKYDSKGYVIEEKYVVERPVKDFIENVKFE